MDPTNMTTVILVNYAHGIDYPTSAPPDKKEKKKPPQPSIQAQHINSKSNLNGNVKMDCGVISIL